MKILNEYPTHHYIEEISNLDGMYCPSCGEKGIWVNHEGDYYEGPNHYCVKCGTIFTLPTIHKAVDANEVKIIEQLKTGKAYKPTTRKVN